MTPKDTNEQRKVTKYTTKYEKRHATVTPSN